MLCRTCRGTSLARCLETFFQVTLSDRIEDTHFHGRCVGLIVTGITHTPITAQGISSLHDQSCFDFEDPDHFVKANGEQTAEKRSEPVDPVVAWEVMGSDSSAKRACRIQ